MMRTRWKQLMACLLAFVLLLGSAGLEALAYRRTSNITVNAWYNQTEARQILPIVNNLRTQGSWYYDEDNTKIQIAKGELSALTWDYMLEKIAMLRAIESAIYYIDGHSGHTRLNGLRWTTAYRDCVNEVAQATGTTFSVSAYGENLAFGHSTATSVFNAWLEEDYDYSGQSHRRNMLSRGARSIGVAQVTYNGRIFWAMEVGGENSGYPDPGAANGLRKMTLEVEADYVKYDGTGSTTAPPQKPSSGSSSNSGNKNDATASKPAAKPLSAVEGFNVQATKYNTIELRWNPVSGAKSYEVYYATSDNVSSAKKLAAAKKTFYRFSKAKCGQSYYFWVIPVEKKTNKGSLSEAPRGFAKTDLIGDPAFTLAKPSYNSVKLKWSKVPGAKKYIVEYSKDGVNWTKVFEKGGTSFTHKGCETGETYYYRVRAQRDSFGTSLEGAGTTQATTVLGHVRNVKVKPSGTNGLKISWKKVPGVAYYEVYRLNKETGEYELLTPSGSVRKPNYVDAGLDSAVSYTYKVIGFTAGGKRQTDLLEQTAPVSQTTKAPK